MAGRNLSLQTAFFVFGWERGRDVLALMVDGLNNQQIADCLVIGLSTDRSQVSSVLSKPAVATRAEAVSLALLKKLLSTKG